MNYFSRRNEYITEYSGHEEVSPALRNRIMFILLEFMDSQYKKKFVRKIYMEFSNIKNLRSIIKEPTIIIIEGAFHEVLTTVEIFLELLNYTKKKELYMRCYKLFNFRVLFIQ